ncbi:MAG: AAA family ATPase [Steroidobacteraceae bacterium]
MLLRKLAITNYKSFLEETTFAFDAGFNVLLGANSSGKTSVLEAIELHKISNTPHRSILNIVEPDTKWIDSSSVFVSYDTTHKELAKVLAPEKSIYIAIENGTHLSNNLPSLSLLNKELKRKPLSLEFKRNTSSGPEGRLQFIADRSNWRSLSLNSQFAAAKINLESGEFEEHHNISTGTGELNTLWSETSLRTYRFSADRKVQRRAGHQPESSLLPDASNLAYCINFLQSKNKNLFDYLNELLNRIFPTIYWIGSPPNGSNQFELEIHTTPASKNRGDLSVPIDQAGTGVFNALAMLYIALTAQNQRFILLEEPNSFLHPRAVRELLAILGEIGKLHQFFITTHSSDVLRAIDASTVTLLEHSGQKSTRQQTTGTKFFEIHAGLLELGIRLTDLHGCDHILWVEGETEEAAFPLLLKHFFPDQAQGLAVLRLHSTGDFESRRFRPSKVANIYKKLSEGSFLAPPMVAITLDTEGKSKSEIESIEKECKGIVHFLPKPMLEDFFFHPDAIAHALTDTPNENFISDVKKALSEAASVKENLLNPKNTSSKQLHAAKTLNFVVQKTLGDGFTYNKTEHGPKIVSWILNNDPQSFAELKIWFERFIKPTKTLQYP